MSRPFKLKSRDAIVIRDLQGRSNASLCRWPTWTRPSAISILGSVFLAVSGCNFSDFSKTSNASQRAVPACDPSSPLAPDAGAENDPIAAWSFDEDSSASPPWLDSVEQRQLLRKPDSAAPTQATTRLNGSGSALFLDGQSYAVTENTDSALFPEAPGFTVSAWISVRLEDFNAAGADVERIWPIVSTIGSSGACGGYQLDLRTTAGSNGPALAFTYQTATGGDAGDSCSNVLEIPLRKPSWAWGNGRWHHVAATYTSLVNNQAALALYLDGTRLEKDTPESSIYDGTIAYIDRAFYVGSNGPNAASASAGATFKGHLDDVALFGRALDEQEIVALNLSQSTRPGPSNCRWSSLEQWDFAVGSTASWALDSTEASAKLNVNDHDWGAGFLSARLLPERDLSLFDTAYLTADVPRGPSNATNMFQFSVSSGDDSCTWMLAANGPDRYVINLRQPNFCVSSSCSYKPDRVEWARVSSEWAHANGSSTITVSRLEFDTTQDPPVQNLPLGGAIGPNGWCWRPQAFDPKALASWTSSPSGSQVRADLSGGTFTTVRLVADLADKPLDLSNCSIVEIDADYPNLDANTPFDFAFLDANGAEQNWSFANDSRPISIDFKARQPPSYDSKSDTTHLFENVPPFHLDRVRLLGIDKPFQYATTSPLTVAIRGVRFLASDGRQGCEVPAK